MSLDDDAAEAAGSRSRPFEPFSAVLTTTRLSKATTDRRKGSRSAGEIIRIALSPAQDPQWLVRPPQDFDELGVSGQWQSMFSLKWRHSSRFYRDELSETGIVGLEGVVQHLQLRLTISSALRKKSGRVYRPEQFSPATGSRTGSYVRRPAYRDGRQNASGNRGPTAVRRPKRGRWQERPRPATLRSRRNSRRRGQ